MWQVTLETSKEQFVYRQLYDCLAQDISADKLKSGDRLPTVRELAKQLGVTQGTVNKAYSLAEKNGLVVKTQGRGTFVKHSHQLNQPIATMLSGQQHHCDFTINAPANMALDELVNPVVQQISQDAPDYLWGVYNATQGLSHHCQSVSEWLKQRGADSSADNTILLSGAQQAILSVLMLVMRSGDTLMVQELTYPGIKSVANLLGLKLQPVAMDEEGFDLEHFESLCRKRYSKVLFILPTAHNPTGKTLSVEQRQKLADIARQYNILLIEDDLYLHHQPVAAIQSLLPENTFYISGFSKCVLPGLRVGTLLAPTQYKENLLKVIQSQNWMTAPFLTELVHRLLDNGLVKQIEQKRKQENKARLALCTRILHRYRLQYDPVNLHIWLKHPINISNAELMALLHQQGVDVIPSGFFSVNNQTSPHLRLCLGNTDRATMEKGLQIVRGELGKNNLHNILF